MSLLHELGGLRPRATLRGRVRRVRERAVRIVTAAGGAAAAWWLARDVLHGTDGMSAKELREAYSRATGVWVDMSSISSTVNGLVAAPEAAS